jgi:hypothetical protein
VRAVSGAFLVALAAFLVAAPDGLAAGTLSESTSAAPSVAVTLNGTDQTAPYTLPVTVTDTRGTGAGWNLTITSTQFKTGAPVTRLAANASTMSASSSKCAVGSCTNPVNTVTYPLAVPAGIVAPAPVKFFNAALASGLGTFTVTPAISVAVPANSLKGTYTSTITLAIATGP